MNIQLCVAADVAQLWELLIVVINTHHFSRSDVSMRLDVGVVRGSSVFADERGAFGMIHVGRGCPGHSGSGEWSNLLVFSQTRTLE